LTSPATWPRVSQWNSAQPKARVAGLLVSLLVSALVSGCAWRQAGNQADFDARYSAGDYQEAAALAARRAVVATMKGPACSGPSSAPAPSRGRPRASHPAFDTTEAFFRVYDEEGALSRWLSTTGALITNDASQPYRGTLYDAIMVNSYKALGFLPWESRPMRGWN